MTVPYISAPAWNARRGRGAPLQPAPRAVPVPPIAGVLDAPRGRAASLGSLIRFGLGRIAWIDVMIQLIAGTAIIVLAWVMVTGGGFQRAVDGFTGWYLGAIAPTFATGVAVVPVDYRDGFFGERLPAPEAIQHPGPGYLTVAEISALVETSGR